MNKSQTAFLAIVSLSLGGCLHTGGWKLPLPQFPQKETRLPPELPSITYEAQAILRLSRDETGFRSYVIEVPNKLDDEKNPFTTTATVVCDEAKVNEKGQLLIKQITVAKDTFNYEVVCPVTQ